MEVVVTEPTCTVGWFGAGEMVKDCRFRIYKIAPSTYPCTYSLIYSKCTRGTYFHTWHQLQRLGQNFTGKMLRNGHKIHIVGCPHQKITQQKLCFPCIIQAPTGIGATAPITMVENPVACCAPQWVRQLPGQSDARETLLNHFKITGSCCNYK